MEMIPVISTAISAIGYDTPTQQMRIKFKQGGIYSYCKVPENIFLELLSATSKGTYYDRYIKDKFDC
jgi:hypothetical protein